MRLARVPAKYQSRACRDYCRRNPKHSGTDTPTAISQLCPGNRRSNFLRLGFWKYRQNFWRLGVNFSDKPISSFWQCLDVRRIFSGIPDRLANFLHRRSQPMFKINERVVRPQFAANFLSGHHLPRVLQQKNEKPERLRLQPYALSVLAQFARPKVCLELIKCNPFNGC